MPVSVTLAPVIQVSHNGDGDAGTQVTAALDKFKKQMTSTVVNALGDAKRRGML